jgi:hypothetical protein
MTLVPVPAETQATTCANCGAALVSDQRYCLECGQPSSPVRLAFLDVLEAHPRGAANGSLVLDDRGAGLVPADPLSASGWLRRNAGWLLLLSVLLLCLIAGLLVGHWATQGKGSPAPQVVKVEGLGALPASSGASAGASSAPSATQTTGAAKTTAKEEAEAAKEAAKETKAEKAPPPAPQKVAPNTLQKLSKSTGKKHQEEVNALGAQPIETG